MIAAVDDNYVYLFVNEAFLDYHQIDEGEAVGQKVYDLIDRDVFENTVKSMVDRCLDGETISYEMSYDFPGKGERYLSIFYYPLRSDDGDILGAVRNMRDITDQKKKRKKN